MLLTYIESGKFLSDRGSNMKVKVSSLLWSLLWIYLICNLSGCVMTSTSPRPGIADQTKKGWRIITGDLMLTCKPDDRITIVLKSGKEVEGKYLRTIPLQEETYAKRYELSKEANKERLALPELGETISLNTLRGDEKRVQFHGFDYGSIRFRRADSPVVGNWSLVTVGYIADDRGSRVESDALKTAMRKGEIPFASAIALKTQDHESVFDLDDVSRVAIKEKSAEDYRVIGVLLVIGAVIALVYFATRETFNKIASSFIPSLRSADSGNLEKSKEE